MRIEDLPGRVASGDRRACARLITLVEDRDPGALAALAALPRRDAFRIGLTGPPGAGKSTLVDLLIQAARKAGRKVGVLAVDPSSPFSGGAILGDRIRMQDHSTDAGVFIRSMGSRGHLGGLAAATTSACRILAGFGCDVILIETMGVGQSEIAIAGIADVTILVLPPNLGDGIQALKAGIMEVPDLFVVNKADLPGAHAAAREIGAMLSETADLAIAGPGHHGVREMLKMRKKAEKTAGERIFMTKGLEGLAESGVQPLWEALEKSRDLAVPGERLATWEALLSEAMAIVHERLTGDPRVELPKESDIHGAAQSLLERLGLHPRDRNGAASLQHEARP